MSTKFGLGKTRDPLVRSLRVALLWREPKSNKTETAKLRSKYIEWSDEMDLSRAVYSRDLTIAGNYPGVSRPLLFRNRQFEPTVIVICVRWYLRYSPYGQKNSEQTEAATADPDWEAKSKGKTERLVAVLAPRLGRAEAAEAIVRKGAMTQAEARYQCELAFRSLSG